MPTYIASYDLKRTNPDPHSAFLEQARAAGWNYWILGSNNVWYRLPNTTLEGNFSSQQAAVAAFKNIWEKTKAAGYTVVVEKWIVAEHVNSNFNSDVTQQN